MDLRKGKKGLIIKTWERCTSLGRSKISLPSGGYGAKFKSKSWPRLNSPPEDENGAPVPVGCFSVYVGDEKQRFVLKTGCLNHPLFLKLLEDAENEYGFIKRNGPLELPCEVDHFLRVLFEMDCGDVKTRWGFQKSNSSYHLLTEPKFLFKRKPWQFTP